MNGDFLSFLNGDFLLGAFWGCLTALMYFWTDSRVASTYRAFAKRNRLRSGSAQFESGYRWAKNSHESGELTLDQIEAYCFGQDHPFDAGARNYLQQQGKRVEL